MKKLIITIDTEGDNLWEWKQGDAIATDNVLFLERFQKLCNKYGFFPVWLTNYEMVQDDRYIDFIKQAVLGGKAEIGMHLHAWNNPPYYNLECAQSGAPYLIEYPENVMEDKIKFLTDLIVEKTGIRPVSHRAGRWATNKKYFELLSKYGYLVDCSVTPHVNWKNSLGQTKGSCGSDYSSARDTTHLINTGNNAKLLEVPVSIIRSNKVFIDLASFKNFAKSIWRGIKGTELWLRPNGTNLKEMMYVLDWVYASENDYAMFMIHSSELMPGGSPAFKDNNSIEKLYKDLELLFAYASGRYEGITLKEYYERHISAITKSK